MWPSCHPNPTSDCVCQGLCEGGGRQDEVLALEKNVHLPELVYRPKMFGGGGWTLFCLLRILSTLQAQLGASESLI